MEELLQVGVITSTHGVRGEVKVFPTTDDPNRFKKLKKVILETKKEKLSLEVQGVKFFKQFVIVNDIEQYKGCSLFVSREDAVALEEDEYFIADLIGMEVYTDENPEELFGTLKDVIETGANEVYLVESKTHGEVLIPAIRQCILSVDVKAQKMQVHLLNGLLDQ